MPRCRSKEKRDARAQRPQFLEGVRKKQLDAQAAVVATELNKVREERTQCDALKVAILRQAATLRKKLQEQHEQRIKLEQVTAPAQPALARTSRLLLALVSLEIPVEISNLAYLTSDVAHRLENLVVEMQNKNNFSDALGEMPKVFSLCAKLQTAKGLEAINIHKELEFKLEELGRGLFRGKLYEQKLAEQARGQAEWVAGVASSLGRPAWHKT